MPVDEEVIPAVVSSVVSGRDGTQHSPPITIIHSLPSDANSSSGNDPNGHLMLDSQAVIHSDHIPSSTVDMFGQLPVVQIQGSALTHLPAGARLVLHPGDREKNYPRLLAALSNNGPVEVADKGGEQGENRPETLMSTVPSSMVPISETITMSCTELNMKPELEEGENDISSVVLCINPASPVPEDHLTLINSGPNQAKSENKEIITNEEIKKADVWKPFREPSDDKPNKYTCKTFDSVIATVSEELLTLVKTQLYPDDQALNNSLLLERLLVAKSHITDLMVRDADTELQLAGDLIDIIEVHNVLMSHLPNTAPCVHKPILACTPVMRDKAVMCDGMTKPPTLKHTRKPVKTKRFRVREPSPESDPFEQEASDTPGPLIPAPKPDDSSVRRSNRRNRRPPVRMVNQDWSRQSHRGRKLNTTSKNETDKVASNQTVFTVIEDRNVKDLGLASEPDQCLNDQINYSDSVEGESSLNLNGSLRPDFPEQEGVTLSVTQLTEVGVTDLLQSITQEVPISHDMAVSEEIESTDVIQESVLQDSENPTLPELEQNGKALPSVRKKRGKYKDYESLMSYKFFCKECSFKTKRESHFIKHMKFHRKNLPVLKCSICSFSTLHLAHLRHHEVSHNPSALTCGICSYKATTEVQMKKHNRMRHREKKDELNAQFDHKCPHCKYTTNRLHLFQRHSLCHSHVRGNKSGLQGMLIDTYKCTHCPYSSNKKELFIRHMENVHSEKRPYLCDLCGMGFKRKDTLKSHRLVHVDKSQRTYRYKCPHCNKGLRSKCHLDEHVSLHSTKREFLCEICGAAFKTRGIQRRHVYTIHKNPKAYPCVTCNKSFNTRFALQRHLRIHEIASHQLQLEIKEEPMAFLCITCKKTFDSKLALDRHLRMHSYPNHQPDMDSEEQLSYEHEINLASFVEVVQGNLPQEADEPSENQIIHVQPISLQDQSLRGGHVITEFQVLPLQTALDHTEHPPGAVTGQLIGEGLDATQQNIEVQLQPTLVQTSTGTTTLLYLTMPGDVTE